MSYIGAFVLLGFALIPIIYMFWAGLHHVDFSLEERQKKEFRQAAVMENFLSVKSPEIEEYQFDDRRAVMPVEYFTQDYNSDISGVGFKQKNMDSREHCYIPKISGLTQSSGYGVYIENHLSIDTERELECTIEKVWGGDEDVPESDQRTSATSLLVRKAEGKPPLPVKVFIYEIGQED